MTKLQGAVNISGGTDRMLIERNLTVLSLREWVLNAIDVLAGLWSHLRPAKTTSDEPLDGLILTILSQNTNDKNRDRAYELLRSRYPRWEDVLVTAETELAEVIKPAGLSNIKASRIKSVLGLITERFGSCSLKPLKGMKKEEIINFLSSLPGVGPKTVACVLLFDLGIPAFPVDTHVNRLCKRIGWVSPKSTPEETQKIMGSVIPADLYWSAHLDIISHGRNICVSRRPKCTICPLNARNLCLFVLEEKKGDKKI